MGAIVFYSSTGGAEIATLTNIFEVSSVPTDPATVSCVITDPAGNITNHTYAGASPADITRESAGSYELQVPVTLTGLWGYVWIGTGDASDVQAGTFTGNPSATVNQWYTSVEELKDRLNITDTQSDFQLLASVQAAARAIESYCGRFFYPLTETRTFVPYCVDTETEILSRDGWRHHDQVQPGEEVLTLNVETGLSEWQPLQAVHYFSGQHEVIRLRTGSHSSMTTPGHRWPVSAAVGPHGALRREWQWRTTETGRTGDRILAAAPVTAPAEPKWSDALVELIAWFWTGGTITKSETVSICQSQAVNPGNIARIRDALTSLLGPPGGARMAPLPRSHAGKPRQYASRLSPAWHEDPADPARGIVKFRLNKLAARVLIDHAPGKVVSTAWLAQLTRAQLELFIRVSLDADGSRCHSPGGSVIQEHITQKDRARMDAFQVACLLAGRSMEVYFSERSGQWHGTVRRIPWRTVWASHRKGHLPRAVVDGVWCPETPNKTWFARRDGTVYATGNTIYDLPIDDITTVTSFAVDRDGDGIFEETWVQGTDYELAYDMGEYNQNASGEARPYTLARTINAAGGGKFFPYTWAFSRLDRIQITGTWGWPQVPFGVRQAVMQTAAEIFKLKDSPFGLAGTSEFGMIRVPKENPYIQKLLTDYVNGRRKIGI